VTPAVCCYSIKIGKFQHFISYCLYCLTVQ
jgi:hypothetical protein